MVFSRIGSVFSFRSGNDFVNVAIQDQKKSEQFDQVAKLAVRAKLSLNEIREMTADFIERNSY